jgi:hypothetical protein
VGEREVLVGKARSLSRGSTLAGESSVNRPARGPAVEVAANCAVIRGDAWADCRALVTMVGRTFGSRRAKNVGPRVHPKRSTVGSASIGALVCALGLAVGCTPVETASTVVVSTPSAAVVLVRTNDTLSPGDVIHIWRRSCLRHCGYRQVAGGVVTVVVLDTPDYAFVDVAPGDDAVAVGDRAVKDSSMFYWHPDPPSD